MIEELVIHLGDRKTGTTAIQNTLAGRLFEADRPIVFPTAGAHYPLARQLETSVDDAQVYANRIARALQKKDGAIGVISTERFEVADPAHLAALFDGPFRPWRDRFRLIGYIRPHAERFLSGFAERCKNGSESGSLDDLADRLKSRPLLYYAPRVARWQAEFGAQYHVRPFIRERLKDGDVVRDFFSFLVADSPVKLTGTADHNPSLPIEDLVLLRHIQGLLRARGIEDRDARIVLGKQLGQILNAHPATHREELRLHRTLAQRLQDTYRDDAAALDAIAFDGTPMSDRLAQATDSAIDAPQSLAPEDWLSPETLRLAAVQTEFLARIIAANPAHFQRAGKGAGQGRGKKPPRNDPVAQRTSRNPTEARTAGPARRLLRLPHAAARRLGKALR